MSKCYIPEISIRTIRNEENMNILKNNYEYTVETKNIICTNDGFYEVSDKNIIKYITIDREGLIFENFIENYTLLVNNSYEKKIGIVDFIPFESSEINLSIFKFNIPESDNKLILEMINKRVTDFYFQTKDKITQRNIFLNNDVSLILKTLNV